MPEKIEDFGDKEFFEYDNGIPAYREKDDHAVNLYIGGEWQQRAYMATMYNLYPMDKGDFDGLLESTIEEWEEYSKTDKYKKFAAEQKEHHYFIDEKCSVEKAKKKFPLLAKLLLRQDNLTLPVLLVMHEDEYESFVAHKELMVNSVVLTEQEAEKKAKETDDSDLGSKAHIRSMDLYIADDKVGYRIPDQSFFAYWHIEDAIEKLENHLKENGSID